MKRDVREEVNYYFASKNRLAKKVVSSSPGLVDFAVGLVNFVLNLPNGQVKISDKFKLKKNCEINSADQNGFEAS